MIHRKKLAERRKGEAAEIFKRPLCAGANYCHNKESYCFGSHGIKQKAVCEGKCVYCKRLDNLRIIVWYLEFSPVHRLSCVVFYSLLSLARTQNILFGL